MATYTITFCDCAENHAGMQKIGEKARHGFSKNDLTELQKDLDEQGYLTKLFCLDVLLPKKDRKNIDDSAYILIIRKYLSKKETRKIKDELDTLEPDKKAFMYGKVCNKNARWNLCFADFSQEADYENAKGTIIDFDDLNYVGSLKDKLEEIIPNSGDLVAEMNYYYDLNKCGIGWHGDAERKKVIGVRIGSEMTICWNWFHRSKPVGDTAEIILKSGDMYLMSEKAVGEDFKSSSKYTLRHSAGCDDFTNLDKYGK